MMKVAESEKDIINHAESKGSLNCGLTAFRQGKKVLLFTPEDTAEDIMREIEGDEDDQATR